MQAFTLHALFAVLSVAVATLLIEVFDMIVPIRRRTIAIMVAICWICCTTATVLYALVAAYIGHGS